MTAKHPLAEVLEAAANGHFPAQDGSVEVLGSPPGPCDVVASFTAHTYVAADVDPVQVRGFLPAGDLSAPLGARFLSWLGERLGAEPGSLDVVLACLGTGSAMATRALVMRDDLADHPRVQRAARVREKVETWADPDGSGVVVLGRGVAGRWEVAVDVEPEHRGVWLGRTLINAARGLVPVGEPLFAQVAPGNAASLRSFLAAGFLPIGSEVIFRR